MNDEMRMQPSYEAQVSGDSLGRYTAKTFGWMFAGLLITFIVAVGGYMTRAIIYVYQMPYWYYAWHRDSVQGCHEAQRGHHPYGCQGTV